MDTRSAFQDAKRSGQSACIYCGLRSGTNDHAPPKCLLKRPLPSNLITLPACKKCNSGFSFAESVVKAFIATVSDVPELVAERQPGGRVARALARDARLRSVIDASRRVDGNYEFTEDVFASFGPVLRKTVQGLYFGLYERIAPADQVQVFFLTDRRLSTAEEVAESMRPSPLREITDEPLPEITANCWMVREPVYFMKLAPIDGGEAKQRVFRLVRETLIEWIDTQPGVFRYAFVKTEQGTAVCVLELWQTIVAAVATPWPDSRGPLRKGRNNPLSRERMQRSRK
jgi:hypothetical protein